MLSSSSGNREFQRGNEEGTRALREKGGRGNRMRKSDTSALVMDGYPPKTGYWQVVRTGSAK